MKENSFIKRLLQNKLIQQFVKFGLVGGLNTILTMIIYYLTYQYIGPSFANGLGFFLTSILGIYLNFKYVFKSDHFTAWTLVKYYTTYGIAMLISMYIPHLWVNVWGLSAKIAPWISLIITIPFNFVLMRIWVFRKPKTVATPEKSEVNNNLK